MADRFEIHATNDVTATHIANKCTLTGALIFAEELLDTWDDVHIRHYVKDADAFKIVAKLSSKGLLF